MAGVRPSLAARAQHNSQNLRYGDATYFSDASVMIRHVEYPTFYSPHHRFHHFYDINTSDSLANRSYFGPLLGLSTLASRKQSRLFNESGVSARQVARCSRTGADLGYRIGASHLLHNFSQSWHSALYASQWRHFSTLTNIFRGVFERAHRWLIFNDLNNEILFLNNNTSTI